MCKWFNFNGLKDWANHVFRLARNHSEAMFALMRLFLVEPYQYQ